MVSLFHSEGKREEYEEIGDRERDAQNTNNGKNKLSLSYFHLYKHATSYDIFCIVIAATLTILAGLGQPLSILLFGKIFGNFIKYTDDISQPSINETQRHYYSSTLHDEIYDFVTKIFSIGIISMTFWFIIDVLWSKTSVNLVLQFRGEIIEKILYQDIKWFDKFRNKNLTTLFSTNLTKLEDGLSQKFLLYIYYMSAFIFGMVLCFAINWKLTVVCILPFLLYAVMKKIQSKLFSKHIQDEKNSYVFARKIAKEVFHGIRTVTALNGQKQEVERFASQLEKLKQDNVNRMKFQSINYGFTFFFLYFSCGLAVWFGLHANFYKRSLENENNYHNTGCVKTLTIYMAWIACWNFYLAQPLLKIFKESVIAANCITEMLRNKSKINKSLKRGLRVINCLGHVAFSSVCVRCTTDKNHQILNHISLTIHPGETVALVGSKESGVLTFFDLLQRFYDPSFGKILVDANNLKELNLACYRNQIGIVQTGSALFSTTISENIRFGNLDACQGDIEYAAKKADVHRFIKTLPNGYNTEIQDIEFCLPENIKWKLFVARALVKNPKLLLIDATSTFWSEIDTELNHLIQQVSGRTTCIIIANNLSRVKEANRIFLISDGQIEVHGSYQRILETMPEFALNITSRTDEDKKRAKFSGNMKLAPERFVSKQKIAEGTLNELFGASDLLRFIGTEWPWIAIGTFCSFSIGTLITLSIILLTEIVGEISSSNFFSLKQPNVSLCWQYLTSGIACTFTYSLQIFSFGTASEKITLHLRNQMFAAMLSQELDWLVSERTYNLELLSDVSKVVKICESWLPIAVASVAIVLTSVVCSLYIQFYLSLVFILFIPIVSFVSYQQYKIQNQRTESRNKMVQKSDKLLEEVIHKIRTIASLNCISVFLGHMGAYAKDYRIKYHDKTYINAFIVAIKRSILFLSLAVSIYYGAWLVLNEHIKYKIVFMVIELQLLSLYTTGQFFTFLSNVQQELVTGTKIMQVLERKSKIQNIPNFSRRQLKHGSIEFSDVYFSHPDLSQTLILDGFNLKIPPGKSVAILAESIAQGNLINDLLQRFYDVDCGEIMIDDVDIKIMDLGNLRKNLMLIASQPDLFDLTIAENIAYGYTDKVVPITEIVKAAKAANIHNFVISLPLGYATPVGYKGRSLSKSQQQRIVIARAFLHNSKILQLEEPADDSDDESRTVIQNALNNVTSNKTCIVTSNDPHKIKHCDLICCLYRGQAVEVGTHEELLGRRGYYYTAWCERYYF